MRYLIASLLLVFNTSLTVHGLDGRIYQSGSPFYLCSSIGDVDFSSCFLLEMFWRC